MSRSVRVNLASGGFTLLELMIVIAIIAIIAAIAIPNLKDARKAANEASAISALRALHSAQTVYREQDKDGNGTLDYAWNTYDLISHGLLPLESYGGGSQFIKTGSYMIYNFTTGGLEPSMFTFNAVAKPGPDVGYNSFDWDAGDRQFYINQTGVIRYTSQQTYQSFSATAWPVLGK